MKKLILFFVMFMLPTASFAAPQLNFDFVPSHGLEEGENVFTDSTIGLKFVGNGAKAVGAGVASPPLFRLYANNKPMLGFLTLEVHGVGEVGDEKKFGDAIHSTIGTTLIQYRNLKFGTHYKYTDSSGKFKDNVAIALSGSISGSFIWVRDLFTGGLLK